MNPLQTHRNFIIPVVGMGVTMGIGSDCYPGTITWVSKNLTRIIVQYDNAEPAEGFDYYKNQVYNITPNPFGVKVAYSWRKRGVWAQKHAPKAVGYLSFNGRRKYSDPSF